MSLSDFIALRKLVLILYGKRKTDWVTFNRNGHVTNNSALVCLYETLQTSSQRLHLNRVYDGNRQPATFTRWTHQSGLYRSLSPSRLVSLVRLPFVLLFLLPYLFRSREREVEVLLWAAHSRRITNCSYDSETRFGQSEVPIRASVNTMSGVIELSSLVARLTFHGRFRERVIGTSTYWRRLFLIFLCCWDLTCRKC